MTTNLQPLWRAHLQSSSTPSKENHDTHAFLRMGIASIHIYALPLHHGDQLIGSLAIVHDSGYIRSESLRIWRENFLSALVYVVLIVLITLLIVRWSIAGPIARTARWMRALAHRPRDVHAHEGTRSRSLPPTGARSRYARREPEYRALRCRAGGPLRVRPESRSGPPIVWPFTFAPDWRTESFSLSSNREPYIHMRRGKTVEVSEPASGLVTAIEPVLRACGGTWVAHGSGDADMEAVDDHDRLLVPPDDPHYTLRRVWLSKEEEQGYYYGFSNEGLWPLCHIAHTRPLFRAADWKHYQEVNRKFADALLEEMEDVQHPVVLVQDYHFALLPRMIKQQRPDARLAIFWHIPWPNPEAFGICPWQRELVDGLLGADLIGFHIQAHCTNFLQTVDRVLGVAHRLGPFLRAATGSPHAAAAVPDQRGAYGLRPLKCRSSRLMKSGRNCSRRSGVEAALMGVGVDRLDYTKGILERFLAIERFLEKYPRYQGVFTFVQIGAPSRTHIKRYHDLQAEVEAEADRINWRFQADQWKPIVLLKRQHSHQGGRRLLSRGGSSAW